MATVQIKWVSPDWDTYWATCDSGHRSEQIFFIFPLYTFTYKEISTDMFDVLNQVQAMTNQTQDAMDRLQLFMELWLDTVNNNPNLIGAINGTSTILD